LQGGLVEPPRARLSEKGLSWVLFCSPPPKATPLFEIPKVDGFGNDPPPTGDVPGASPVGSDVPKPDGDGDVLWPVVVGGACVLIVDPKGDEVANPEPNGFIGVDSEFLPLDAPNGLDAVG